LFRFPRLDFLYLSVKLGFLYLTEEACIGWCISNR
jgi:hypothetical protein